MGTVLIVIGLMLLSVLAVLALALRLKFLWSPSAITKNLIVA